MLLLTSRPVISYRTSRRLNLAGIFPSLKIAANGRKHRVWKMHKCQLKIRFKKL